MNARDILEREGYEFDQIGKIDVDTAKRLNIGRGTYEDIQRALRNKDWKAFRDAAINNARIKRAQKEEIDQMPVRMPVQTPAQEPDQLEKVRDMSPECSRIITESQLLTDSLMESIPGPPGWLQASYKQPPELSTSDDDDNLDRR